MNYRMGMMVLLALLVLGGCPLASARLPAPQYGTVSTISYATQAPAYFHPSSAPAYESITPAGGFTLKPIHGGDFHVYVNPDWSVIQAEDNPWTEAEVPSSDSLNPFTYIPVAHHSSCS